MGMPGVCGMMSPQKKTESQQAESSRLQGLGHEGVIVFFIAEYLVYLMLYPISIVGRLGQLSGPRISSCDSTGEEGSTAMNAPMRRVERIQGRKKE